MVLLFDKVKATTLYINAFRFKALIFRLSPASPESKSRIKDGIKHLFFERLKHTNFILDIA